MIQSTSYAYFFGVTLPKQKRHDAQFHVMCYDVERVAREWTTRLSPLPPPCEASIDIYYYQAQQMYKTLILVPVST